jgi:hypothetical protein
MLLSPKWQQQSQQQPELLLTTTDTHTDESTAATIEPLRLEFTTLASVLKLQQISGTYCAAAIQFLVEHTGFVSYNALADVHSAKNYMIQKAIILLEVHLSSCAHQCGTVLRCSVLLMNTV